jgi:lipoprotein-releasing system permease protein
MKMASQCGEVSMGLDLAHSLGIFEGDEVSIVAPESLLLPPGEIPSFEKVIVKNILRTNVSDIDSQVLFYGRGSSLQKIQELAQVEKGIEVRFKNPDNYLPLMKSLKEKGYSVQSWVERNSALFYSLKLEKIVMGSFLGLTVLIASFSILSVLVLLVTQKRTDIGILISMGLSPLSARKVFTQLGIILSCIGLIGGLSLGLLVCWILKAYPLIQLPDIYYDRTIPIHVDFVVVGGILFFSLIIAFIASWLPAYYSTRIKPAEALRLNVDSMSA